MSMKNMLRRFHEIIRLSNRISNATATSTGSATRKNSAIVHHPSVFPARSWMFSGKSWKHFEHASNVCPDVLLLDMEDSVPLTKKSAMRDMYVDALTKNIFKNMNVYIRLNGLDEYEEVMEDVKAFTCKSVAGFVLPKLKTVSDLNIYNILVHEKEQTMGITEHIKFVPLLETPSVYFDIDSLAGNFNRNVALMIGSADFAAETFCINTSSTLDMLHSKAVIAARKNKIEPIAGPYLLIDDHIGFEHFCSTMKKKGFSGCLTLNPDQTNIANIVFGYSHMETKLANTILHVSNSSENGNSVSTLKQTVQNSRELIGPPQHKTAAGTLIRHELLSNDIQNSKRVQTPTIIPTLCKRYGLHGSVQIGSVISDSSHTTVSKELIIFWNASFFNFSNDDYFSPCNDVKGNNLPISLLVSICLGLSVRPFSESAIVHLGFYDAFQHQSVRYGDILKSIVYIDDAFNAQTNNTIVHSSHTLLNAKENPVFSLKKRTMFSQLKIESPKTSNGVGQITLPAREDTPLRQSVFERSVEDGKINHYPPHLCQDHAVVHGTVKSFSDSETTMLMRLLKFTNNHHFKRQCYGSTEVLVAGPFVVAATLSSFSKDFPNVLYEDIIECTNINKVIMGESITTLTFLLDRKTEDDSSDFQELTLKHLGIKNIDPEVLCEIEIPLRLFIDQDLRKPSHYEKVCLESCPILYRKIACQVVRRVLTPKSF